MQNRNNLCKCCDSAQGRLELGLCSALLPALPALPQCNLRQARSSALVLGEKGEGVLCLCESQCKIQAGSSRPEWGFLEEECPAPELGAAGTGGELGQGWTAEAQSQCWSPPVPAALVAFIFTFPVCVCDPDGDILSCGAAGGSLSFIQSFFHQQPHQLEQHQTTLSGQVNSSSGILSLAL